ncbi:FAD-dependent oxidoreductase [Piscinibacter sp.]|uniref:FAD-dependent oxidoreductase n=1 Tax=Piscinibacter sp. TaxID=1903157 RepID=UPI0039E5F04B
MNTIPSPRGRAIVIGASLAGLLAARVLAERFADVVLLERDELPERAAPRKGTPHALQPHGLLARGRQVLEALFPGLADALVARGALAGDIGTAAAVDANGERFARRSAGVDGLAVSRLALEAELRRRVRALAGVCIVEDAEVEALLHDRGRVAGVRWRPRDGGTAQSLAGTLVVDCSGRGSHGPLWLRDGGYDAPPEERVTIGLAYTSAVFRRDSAAPPLAVVIGCATPALPRPSILIAMEPDDEGRERWIAGVGGYAGDHVEPTLEAMAQRAQAIGHAEIEALALRGEAIAAPARYAFAHSQRWRYERLRRLPAGFVALGDALASFNPVYGQGMTVAACEALALRDALARGDAGDARLPRRFFAAAARIVDAPWQLAVGADLALPGVGGARPWPARLIGRHVARVQRAAVHDADVALAFVKVMHLLAPPHSLFAPAIVRRVWRTLPAGSAT